MDILNGQNTVIVDIKVQKILDLFSSWFSNRKRIADGNVLYLAMCKEIVIDKFTDGLGCVGIHHCTGKNKPSQTKRNEHKCGYRYY